MKYLWLILACVTASLGQTLSQQKVCDEQAYLRFQREFENIFTNASSYFSHFDPKVNVCYVMLAGSGHVVGTQDDKITVVSVEVKDAFEGSNYGEFYLRICADCSDKPTQCYVIPHGSDASIRCDSSAKFYGLVRKYFGVKGRS